MIDCRGVRVNIREHRAIPNHERISSRKRLTAEAEMALFHVEVRGRGLWIAIDDEVQRVEFAVTRVVEAANAAEAAQLALRVVQDDRRARSAPGRSAPQLTVDVVQPADVMPDPQPGFRFHPDPP